MDRELRDLCHSVFSCKSLRRNEISVPDRRNEISWMLRCKSLRRNETSVPDLELRRAKEG